MRRRAAQDHNVSLSDGRGNERLRLSGRFPKCADPTARDVGGAGAGVLVSHYRTIAEQYTLPITTTGKKYRPSGRRMACFFRSNSPNAAHAISLTTIAPDREAVPQHPAGNL